MEKEEGRVVVVGRVEIDTRWPFKSVKEAVMMFGERVLAREVIANKLEEIRSANEFTGEAARSRSEALMAELEEAKNNLKNVRDENKILASRVESLQHELDKTRRDLNLQLKRSRAHDLHKQVVLEPEIEDVKFVENLTRVGDVVNKQTPEEEEEDREEGFRFHREGRRTVKFASPPALTRVIVAKDQDQGSDTTKNNVLERPPSLKKKKKKPLVGVMGWLLPKKKRNEEADHE